MTRLYGGLYQQHMPGRHAILTVIPLERAHVGEYVRTMSSMGEPADESIVECLSADDVVLPPADVILRRRLARADDMTRHFSRAASVVLDTSEELAAITYVMEGDTKGAITALDKACEIRPMRQGPHGEESFVHPLMQREVYGEMGVNQRRYLHARAGKCFMRER